MMKILFLAAALWLATVLPTTACTCSNSVPGTCPGLQKGDVVFMGTVTDSEKVDATPANSATSDSTAASTDAATNADAKSAEQPSAPTVRYHFHVDEEFAGWGAQEVDIFSGGDDGDCGYKFTKGAQYVVFTQQENGGNLYATICSGTRPTSEARALLPQLRAMKNGQRFADVFGSLKYTDPPFLGPPDDPPGEPVDTVGPLAHVAIRLRSKLDRFQTTTDDKGIFSFYDVHAGEYTFTANLPPRMQLSKRTTPGELPPFTIPEGACYEYDVEALPTGHIQGSVLDSVGKPLPVASVELFRVGHYDDARPGLWSFQGAKGIFDFDHIGPGQYILVFNRTNKESPNAPYPRAFYPGVSGVADAMPIVLKGGQDLVKVNMKVADEFPNRKVRVHLKWSGVRPAGDVVVQMLADKGDNPSARKTAENVYEFTLLKSGHYTLAASEDLQPQRAPAHRRGAVCALPPKIDTESRMLAGTDGDNDVTLTFPKPGCN